MDETWEKWFSDLVIYTTSITLESCKHLYHILYYLVVMKMILSLLQEMDDELHLFNEHSMNSLEEELMKVVTIVGYQYIYNTQNETIVGINNG